jgi:hypothetical protein
LNQHLLSAVLEPGAASSDSQLGFLTPEVVAGNKPIGAKTNKKEQSATGNEAVVQVPCYNRFNQN